MSPPLFAEGRNWQNIGEAYYPVVSLHLFYSISQIIIILGKYYNANSSSTTLRLANTVQRIWCIFNKMHIDCLKIWENVYD